MIFTLILMMAANLLPFSSSEVSSEGSVIGALSSVIFGPSLDIASLTSSVMANMDLQDMMHMIEGANALKTLAQDAIGLTSNMTAAMSADGTSLFEDSNATAPWLEAFRDLIRDVSASIDSPDLYDGNSKLSPESDLNDNFLSDEGHRGHHPDHPLKVTAPNMARTNSKASAQCFIYICLFSSLVASQLQYHCI